MAFVQGKCESCGGILVVDNSLKAANCPFCGTAYVVQDSINYYNTTIKVDTMHANVVNVSDESSSDGRIKAGDALMKLGKYEKAELEYKKATELTPQNYKGWLGLIESHTHNYSKRIRSSSELRILSDYSRSAKMFAPDGSGDAILKRFEDYRGGEIEKNTNEAIAYNNAIFEQRSALKQLDEQEFSLTQNYNQNQQKLDSLNSKLKYNQKNNPIAIAVIWLIIQGFVGFVCYSINKTISMILLLGEVVPTTILIVIANKNNKLINEINKLASEQESIQNQISDLSNRERAYRASIQANEKELEKYTL